MAGETQVVTESWSLSVLPCWTPHAHNFACTTIFAVVIGLWIKPDRFATCENRRFSKSYGGYAEKTMHYEALSTELRLFLMEGKNCHLVAIISNVSPYQLV
jgi:hypothetical protein